ncbi:MAG: glycerophosphodiester phosphodiesterase [Haloarculaceae archaeon]
MAQYPENTLTAMREAAAVVDVIETDVRRCGSGELVVFHDDDLDRVTDATGPIAETPYDRLRDVEILDSGEGVPLLEDVFETVPPDVGLNLELKAEDVVEDVASIAARYDHEVIVSTFDADELAAAGEAGCDTLAYLFVDDPEGSLDVAANLGCEYVHPYHRLCVETRVVERAHERGFAVNAWPVETEESMRVMRDVGVDGVFVDDCTFAGR